MHARLSILLMLLGLALTPGALADSYTYTTSGCFTGGTCVSNGNSSVPFTDALGADATLSFTSVSSSTNTNGSSFSLGSFELTSLPGISYDTGSKFTLGIDFSNPSGTSGNPLVAEVGGLVAFGAGVAEISFTSGSQVFTYPGGSLTLDLSANPIYLTALNQKVSVKASIVSMPEGSSLAMLGISGLVLVGAFFKKHNPLATGRAC